MAAGVGSAAARLHGAARREGAGMTSMAGALSTLRACLWQHICIHSSGDPATQRMLLRVLWPEPLPTPQEAHPPVSCCPAPCASHQTQARPEPGVHHCPRLDPAWAGSGSTGCSTSERDKARQSGHWGWAQSEGPGQTWACVAAIVEPLPLPKQLGNDQALGRACPAPAPAAAVPAGLVPLAPPHLTMSLAGGAQKVSR